jgi:hypothetical protein
MRRGFSDILGSRLHIGLQCASISRWNHLLAHVALTVGGVDKTKVGLLP